MIAFIYQVMDWIRYGQPHFFVIFFVYVWVVWTVKVLGSRRYAPAVNDFIASTSVVMPVYQEPPEVLARALASIRAAAPDEILAVVDGGDPEMVEVASQYADRVIPIAKAGKRTALETGIPLTHGEITIIVDSDTIFELETIRELVKPFADPTIGGATTNQRIFEPDRTFVRHCCDWMEELRFSTSTPAQSSFGTVGCLPGRAIAIRRELLVEFVPQLMTDSFLGIRCEIGDDRALTNFTLKKGYRTVFQSTAKVYTDAPDDWLKFTRQQLRWARSSQRETLKNLRWLIRKPFLAFCFISDIVTPFLLAALVVMFVYNWLTGQTETLIIGGTPLENPAVALSAAYLGAILSIGIRQLPRLRRNPKDILRLPIFVLALTFILVPVRILGFLTMGEQRWSTRGAGDEVDDQEPTPTGQPVTPRVWAVRGVTVLAGIMLLLSLFWYGINFEQRTDPYAQYRDQIEQVTGR